MKKTLRIIWNIYCHIGAGWLAFTILSLCVFHQTHKEQVPGTVKEIIKTEWDGITEVHALIETEDNKGNVLAKLYRAGIETNDTITVNLSTSGRSRSHIHASVLY